MTYLTSPSQTWIQRVIERVEDVWLWIVVLPMIVVIATPGWLLSKLRRFL